MAYNSWRGQSAVGQGLLGGALQGIGQFGQNFASMYQKSSQLASEVAHQKAEEELRKQALMEQKEARAQQKEMEDRRIAEAERKDRLRQGMEAVKEGRPEAIPALFPAKPEDITAAQQANVPVGMRNLETVSEMAGMGAPQLREPELGRPTATPSAGVPGFVTGAEGDTTSYVPQPSMQLNAPETPMPGRLEAYAPTPTVSREAEPLALAAEQTRQDLGKKMQFQAQERMRLEGAKQGAMTERTMAAADIAAKSRERAAAIAAAPANRRNQLAEKFHVEEVADLTKYALENDLIDNNGQPLISAARAEVIKASKIPPAAGTPEDRELQKWIDAETKIATTGIGEVDMSQYGVPVGYTKEQALQFVKGKQNEARSRKGGGGGKMTYDQIKAAHPEATDADIAAYLQGK